MTKIRGWFFSFAVLWLGVSPSLATVDLLGFSAGNTQTTFDGVSQFSSKDWANTSVYIYRSTLPTGSALFMPTFWGSGLEGFTFSMTMSNITATTADSVGSFTIMDMEGDSFGGSFNGAWTKEGNGGSFSGSLTNVAYTSVVNDSFDGHLGSSISTIFSSPLPWQGSVIAMTMEGGWFVNHVPFDLTGGMVNATVVGAIPIPVPIPGAFLLTVFGAMGVTVREARRKIGR